MTFQSSVKKTGGGMNQNISSVLGVIIVLGPFVIAFIYITENTFKQ